MATTLTEGTFVNKSHPLCKGLRGWWLTTPDSQTGYSWKDQLNGKNATAAVPSGHSLPTLNSPGNSTWSKQGNRKSQFFSNASTNAWYWDTGIFTLNSVSSYTYSFWCRRLNTGDKIGIGSSGLGGDSTRDSVVVYNSNICYVLGASAYGTFTYNDVDTSWHHITVVFDGSAAGNSTRLVCYFDGAAQTLSFSGTVGTTSGAHTGPSTPRAFYIGCELVTPGYTQGFIDDVKIWNRPLQANEARQNYVNSLNNFEGLLISQPIYVRKIVSTTYVSVPLGTKSLTGFAPTIQRQTNIQVPAGSLTATGFAPTISQQINRAIPAGSLAINGLAPIVVNGVTCQVAAGSVTATALPPTIINHVNLPIPLAAMDVEAQTPSTSIKHNYSIPQASLTINGFAPSITNNVSVHIPVGMLAIDEFAPTITNNVTVAIPTANLTTTANNPATRLTSNVAIDVGEMELTGLNPSIVETTIVSIPLAEMAATANSINLMHSIGIEVDTLSLTALAPTIVNPVTIAIPLVEMECTLIAPLVFNANSIMVDDGYVELTPHVPTIVNNVTLAIPCGSLSVSGFVPAVQSQRRIAVPKGTLTLNKFAPVVYTPNTVVTMRAGIKAGSLIFTTIDEKSIVAQDEMLHNFPLLLNVAENNPVFMDEDNRILDHEVKANSWFRVKTDLKSTETKIKVVY